MDSNNIALNEQRNKRKRIRKMKTGIVTFIGIWFMIITVVNVILCWRVIVLQNEVNALLRGKVENTSVESAAPIQDISDETQEIGTLVTSDSGTGEENLRNADDILKVYLTFDDGPSDNSNQILDILDDYGVKATFFVTGKENSSSIAVYQRIVNEGHTIGMHSYSHKYNELYQSMVSFSADYNRIHNLILNTTGVDSHFYRFPGGSSNQVSDTDMAQFIQFLNSNNVTYVDWNVSSGDATSEPLTRDDLVENVMNDVVKYKTSVVLLHDASDKKTTVQALPKLIESLQREGAIILPISDDTKPIQHVTLVDNQ